MNAATRITSIKKLDSGSFDTLLGQQNPFGSQECIFDLRGIELITPAALVQLASACYALRQDGRHPVIMIDNESVRSYLMRCSFFKVVQPVAKIEPQAAMAISSLYDHLRHSNPMLIEVTKIEAGAELPNLLDQIAWVLRHRLKYRKYDAFDVTTAVSEVCQNTFDHNSQTCGFIAMQVYGQDANRFLEIGMTDYGDGLTATLGRNPKNPQISSDLVDCSKNFETN
jgi:hypothetical protein